MVSISALSVVLMCSLVAIPAYAQAAKVKPPALSSPSGLKSLTEAQRKSAYWEYSAIADRIRRETYKSYPPDGPLDMSKERARQIMSEKLYDKYTLPLRNRLKVNKIDLVQIEMEGLKNRWPRPASK